MFQRMGGVHRPCSPQHNHGEHPRVCLLLLRVSNGPLCHNRSRSMTECQILSERHADVPGMVVV